MSESGVQSIATRPGNKLVCTKDELQSIASSMPPLIVLEDLGSES